MQTLVAAAAAPAHGAMTRSGRRFGKLVADSSRIMDFPAGFEYRVIARMGEEMSDGLLVPAEADGMAAFTGRDGRINLVCNHENHPSQQQRGPFGPETERLQRIDAACVYDNGEGETPGSGGTTTLIYDPRTRSKERQFLSLAGTELNCAGGATPWGSWLSCEETFSDPGSSFGLMMSVHREQRHGYVFEVPAAGTACTKPMPLTDMGRFEHEAAAVDPASGVVYLSEDRYRSLLYRFLPSVPGELHRGGRLQALAIDGQDQFDTRNWESAAGMPHMKWLESHWIDLRDVDSDDNDLRLRGYADGAARFARGEGLCFAEGSVFMTCTIGGPDRLGQVFEYRLSPAEGSDGESADPGRLRLLAESTRSGILRNADNICMSPWGDLIICEDTAGHCRLIGLRPDGQQYYLANNAYTDSELAGICFAPDGKTMFVNIQEQGLTLAINGPW